MKIKYDYNIFNSQEYGGISKYFSYLFINISKLNNSTKIVTIFHRNRHLKYLNQSYKFGFFILSRYVFFNRIIKFLSFIYDYLNSKIYKYNIIHKTYFPSKINILNQSFYIDSFSNKSCKKVITFYDMSFYIYSNLLRNSKNMINSQIKQCSEADLIIAISNSTKKDLVKYFKIPEKKIKVVHLGVDKNIFFKKKFKV